MIVVNDLCGDEDATQLEVSYLQQRLTDEIYRRLRNTKPIPSERISELLESQYRQVLLNAVHIHDYDPKVKCSLGEDGIMNVSFLAPQWVADMMNEGE